MPRSGGVVNGSVIMKIINVGQGHVDIEHEGELFRLSGENPGGGDFYAWVGWIRRLIPGDSEYPYSRGEQTIQLAEPEQVRIMNLVIELWNYDKFPIIFLDDNLNVLCTTKKTDESADVSSKKSWWRRKNKS